MRLPIIWDPYADFVPHVLPNGLTVYMQYMPKQPGLAIGCVIHSGAQQDPEGQAGVAHFVEHLIAENAMLPSDKIESSIEMLGGDVSLGATSDLYTRYGCNIPTNRDIVRNTLDLFGDMLLRARLLNKVEKQRRIILEEYRRGRPTDVAVAMEKAEHEALYSNTSRSSFVGVLGTPESIEAITQPQLQAFYDAHYTPSNMSVVMVGGMEVAEMLDAINMSCFAHKKAGSRTPAFSMEAHTSPLSVHSYDIRMSDFTKATMSTGNYRTVAKIPGTIGGGIMSVFTYTLNRLLNASIRESRGWTYAINASSGRTPPFREITIESNNIALEALDHIDSAVADCIASIPSKEETVRVVRLGLMNSDVMISHSPMTICRDVVSDLSHHGRIKSLETYHREIEAVTAGDLARVAEHLEPEFRWVRIIRP